jgi:regulatory protein
MSENEQIYIRAMNTAVRLLARRNHTNYELRQKLKQRKFDTEVITKVLSECERLNYVNDEETARCYFRELKIRGYGIRRIRFSMKKKGLAEEIIDELLSKHEHEDELENARRAMEKKMRALSREKDMRKRKEKIFRFLASRGFPGSVISELLRDI